MQLYKQFCAQTQNWLPMPLKLLRVQTMCISTRHLRAWLHKWSLVLSRIIQAKDTVAEQSPMDEPPSSVNADALERALRWIFFYFVCCNSLACCQWRATLTYRPARETISTFFGKSFFGRQSSSAKKCERQSAKSSPTTAKCVVLDLTDSNAAVPATVKFQNRKGDAVVENPQKLTSQVPEDTPKNTQHLEKKKQCVLIDCTSDTPVIPPSAKPKKRVFGQLDKNQQFQDMKSTKKIKKSKNKNSKHTIKSSSSKKGSIGWFFNKKSWDPAQSTWSM